MKYFKKIVGERLYLSPMNVEDAETYVNWLNNRDVSDNLGMTANVVTVPEEKVYIDSKKSNDYAFSIVLNDDTLIGNLSLMDMNILSGKASLGIFIGDEKNRNKGYGPEAIKLIVDYGFNILRLHNIDLRVFSFNERAIKAYEKVGFKEYGRRHESYFLDGKYYDEIFMEIINERN